MTFGFGTRISTLLTSSFRDRRGCALAQEIDQLCELSRVHEAALIL